MIAFLIHSKGVFVAQLITLAVIVQNYVASVEVKCGWWNQIAPDLEEIVGQAGGLAIGIGGLVVFGALAGLVFLFATKWRNVLLLFIVGAAIASSILISNPDIVAGKC